MSILKRTKQCAKCPWRKDTNPLEIPDGYSVQQHKELKDTIAKENPTLEDYLEALDDSKPMKVMGCHEHTDEEQVPCVGWVYNQMQSNNIKLRLQLIDDPIVSTLQVIGQQHGKFEDTLP